MASEPSNPTTLPYRPCVGVMVLDRQGSVWVGRRADAPNRPEGWGTWWQMPQGGIDEGEDARVAALRELREETGMYSVTVLGETAGWHTYDLPVHLVGKAWGGRYRGQRQKWFVVRFTGPESEIVIEPPPGHDREFDAWRWASVDELMELVVPFKRDVYRAVLDELGGLALPEGGSA
jgi:putative (di)nucleoside polyphosphate hydrolase